MIPTLKSFGKYLQELMRQKGLSATQLAVLLDYKSKTSIVRVIKEESNQESRQRLFERLCAAAILTEAEQQQLEAALAVSAVGTDRANARVLLHNLLFENRWEDELFPDDVEQALAQLANASSARILALNCCWPNLFARFQQILSSNPTHTIQHYFTVSEGETNAALALCSVAQLTPLANYAGYAIHAIDETIGGHSANVLCFSFRAEDGSPQDTLIIFTDAQTAFALTLPSASGLYAYMERVLHKAGESAESVIAGCYVGNGVEEFIALAQFCAELERERDAYQIKSGMCINLIAPEHMLASLTDGGILDCFDGVDPQIVAGMLEMFMQFQDARFRNTFQSKRVKHLIFSLDDIRNFAHTGLFGEHFQAMRPFTPAERIAILTHCVEQCVNNGYFSVYFWNDDMPDPIVEMNCFDGLGIMVFPANIDSAAADQYRGSLIRHPRLISLFIEYFRNDLLLARTIPFQQGIAYLRELIEELKAIYVI